MKNLKTVMATTAVLLASLPVFAQDLVKIGTFVPEKSVGVAHVIKPWMEAVNSQTDSVKLQGFWGGTLGKSPFKQFELVQNGVMDVSWVLPAYTAGQFPEMVFLSSLFCFALPKKQALLVGSCTKRAF